MELRLAASALLFLTGCSVAGLPAPTREARAALERGEEALVFGEWDAATRAFEDARRLGAARFDTAFGVARAELGQGQGPASLHRLAGIAREHPSRFAREAHPAYCRALAAALPEWLAEGGIDAALRALDTAEGLPPCPQASLRADALGVLLAAAEAAERSGANEQARSFYERAVRGHPGSPLPARGEARLLLAAGRVGEAIAVLDAALVAHRDDAVLQALMVQALSAAGRPGGR